MNNVNYVDERGNYQNIENLTLMQIYNRGFQKGFEEGKREGANKVIDIMTRGEDQNE